MGEARIYYAREPQKLFKESPANHANHANHISGKVPMNQGTEQGNGGASIGSRNVHGGVSHTLA